MPAIPRINNSLKFCVIIVWPPCPKFLSSAKKRSLDIPQKLEPLYELVMNAKELTQEVANIIQILWETDTVQQVIVKMQLPGTTDFVKHAFRFAQQDFVPSFEDTLQALSLKKGVMEVTYIDESKQPKQFIFVDVEQTSELRHWLHCFADISFIIFLVPLDEYDVVLDYDPKTNKMNESLTLFAKLSGLEWFKSTAFILVLCYSECFHTKIEQRPMREVFEDYDKVVDGLSLASTMSEIEKSYEYIKAQYVKVFNGHRLYSIVTCSIDTGICDQVFAAIRDAVLSTILQEEFADTVDMIHKPMQSLKVTGGGYFA